MVEVVRARATAADGSKRRATAGANCSELPQLQLRVGVTPPKLLSFLFCRRLRAASSYGIPIKLNNVKQTTRSSTFFETLPALRGGVEQTQGKLGFPLGGNWTRNELGQGEKRTSSARSLQTLRGQAELILRTMVARLHTDQALPARFTGPPPGRKHIILPTEYYLSLFPDQASGRRKQARQNGPRAPVYRLLQA